MTVTVYDSLDDVPAARRVVALGTFDGVHRGHARIIGGAVERAAAVGARSLVATFHPRPATVLAPDRHAEALCTLERRLALIGAIGVDEIVVVPFTLDLAGLSPEAFAADVVRDRLGAAEVVVGANFFFGHRRLGTPRVLAELGEEAGFDVTVVPLLEVEGGPISSTRVRELIRRGAVEEAGRLLGRPVAIEGIVVRGDGRGRLLGVPTANVAPPPDAIVAAEGVYAGDAVLPTGERFCAAISIGTNPTFEAGRAVSVEAHLLHFDRDLYDQRLQIELRRWLRGQVAFDGVDELLEQIAADIALSDL